MARSELLGGRSETRFRMVRDSRWKAVTFPQAPMRLFDLEHDPGEEWDLAANPLPEAPVAELAAALAQGGSWEELEERRRVDRERSGVPRSESSGSVQYRLADGRIVEGDAQLYEGAR